MFAALLFGAEIEFDRQFQVVHAFLVAQQQVQLAQGMPALADRQVGRQQFDAGSGAQGELPETFVIQPQAPHRALRQPIEQGAAVVVEVKQPVGQGARRARPWAGAQGMALRPGGAAE
ncbi:hypothetical protein D9M68_898510 [compost metagenome]